MLCYTATLSAFIYAFLEFLLLTLCKILAPWLLSHIMIYGNREMNQVTITINNPCEEIRLAEE